MKKTNLKNIDMKKVMSKMGHWTFRGSRILLMTLGGVTLAVVVLGTVIAVSHNPANALSFGWRGNHHDFNDDGKITTADVAEMVKEHFERFDDNNDGKLTQEELGGKWGRRGNRMAGIDANNDSEITLGEFMKHAMERFIAFDTDGDGEISEAEHGNAGHVVRAEKRKRLFEVIDSNNDGVISAEEYEQADDLGWDHRGKRGWRHGDWGKRGWGHDDWDDRDDRDDDDRDDDDR